jgi:hypothetical protein
LAYLHGDPAIFSHLENTAQELKFQAEMQNAWINFAHGETLKSGDSRVLVFGPNAQITETEKVTFLSEYV